MRGQSGLHISAFEPRPGYRESVPRHSIRQQRQRFQSARLNCVPRRRKSSADDRPLQNHHQPAPRQIVYPVTHSIDGPGGLSGCLLAMPVQNPAQMARRLSADGFFRRHLRQPPGFRQSQHTPIHRHSAPVQRQADSAAHSGCPDHSSTGQSQPQVRHRSQHQ